MGLKYARELLIKNEMFASHRILIFCVVCADNNNSDQSEKIEQK